MEATRLALSPRWRRRGSVFLCAIYGLLAVMHFLAHHLTMHPTSARLAIATRLEPWNAEYWYELGSYQFFVEGSADQAEISFHKSVDRNGYSADHWLALALAHFAMEQYPEQQAAIGKAVEVDPTASGAQREAATQLLARGDEAGAFALYKNVLAHDLGSDSIDPLLKLLFRIAEPARVVDEALPQNVQIYLRAIAVLSSKGDLPGADLAWHKLAKLRPEVHSRQLLQFVEFLTTRDIATARADWEFAVVNNAELQRYQRADNLVVNGDFEHPLLNLGFDWHQEERSELDAGVSGEAVRGGAAYRIHFHGAPGGDTGLSQRVIVDPSTTYEFRCAYKVEHVESGSGPRLIVLDSADSPASTVLYSSDELIGDSPWREISSRFSTGASTHFVEIRVRSLPEGRLIKGTLWIDDVELRKVKAE